MLLFALALGLTAVLALAVATRRAPRARLTVGYGTQTISIRHGRRILIVNGDIRPHRLTQVAGPDAGLGDIRLDRAGATCVIRLREPGTYTLRTHAGPCLVPWLEDEAPLRHATFDVVVR